MLKMVWMNSRSNLRVQIENLETNIFPIKIASWGLYVQLLFNCRRAFCLLAVTPSFERIRVQGTIIATVTGVSQNWSAKPESMI